MLAEEVAPVRFASALPKTQTSSVGSDSVTQSV
jgi:hypothetical protein